MKFRNSIGSVALAATLGCLVAGSVSCKKKDGGTVAPSAPLPAVLLSNNVGGLPGAVYKSQVASPIHWQPWTQESLNLAKKAGRLVFAVVAVPQQPVFQNVLAKLAADPTLVAAIHSNYVPVLIDGNASREIGLLSADLCVEIKQGLQLPLFLWMTPEANPVAWIPVTSESEVGNLFKQSHTMVTRMWMEDPQYVIKNSSLDNANRRERIAARRNVKVMSTQPAEDAVRAVRHLTSLYDPLSRNFDEAGGLFPAGALDLVATAAIQPGLPEEVRSRSLETTRELLNDLLPSAMFDPLAGGVFSARLNNSWSLPSFSKDCVSHARVVTALVNGYRATGDTRALEKAVGLVRFSEEFFGTPEGLFALGPAPVSSLAAWLWSVEQVRKELPPEDAAWWIAATGMKSMGNLASETDPKREFFRSNSLAISQTLAELAAAQSQTVEVFGPRFETARQTLLKARDARIGNAPRDDQSHAEPTFRMVSAYAAVFGVTGDEIFRGKAVSLLEKARVSFKNGAELRTFTQDAPASIGAARAFTYGLAIQAALDVSVITSDEKWSDWTDELASTAAELFTTAEFLKECPDEAKIIDLPVTDLAMLFDDSTAGLISFAECRLSERRLPLVKTLSELATPLPTFAAERPILHTDLLQATLAREFRVTIIGGSDLSPELKLEVEKLPVRMFQRRTARAEDEVPPGSVIVKFGSGEKRTVATADALREAVLPSSPKL